MHRQCQTAEDHRLIDAIERLPEETKRLLAAAQSERGQRAAEQEAIRHELRRVQIALREKG